MQTNARGQLHAKVILSSSSVALFATLFDMGNTTAQPPRIELAIYRLKNARTGKPAFEGIIADGREDQVQSMPASIQGIDEAMIFAKRVKAVYPGWTGFLEGAAPDIAAILEKHAANSVVVAVVRGRIRHALVFGHGRSLLDRGVIVRGFGLRCALGLIDPESIGGIGIKEVEHTTLFSSIQSNRRSRFDRFRVDTEASLLNGVVGWPETRQRYYTRALGADPLHLNPAIVMDDLAPLLNWIEKVYAKKEYTKLGYDWIDHVSAVRDTELISALEKKLATALKRSPGPSMGPPEGLDYKSVSAFTVVGLGRGARLEKISLEDIKKARGAKHVTVEVLRDARIKALNHDGEMLKAWCAFNWLLWSGRHRGRAYVLQDGVFYEIDQQYEKRIDSYLSKLKAIPPQWPDSSAPPSVHEFHHNKDLAINLGSTALLLDQRLFSKAFRGRAKLELCDIFVRGNPSLLVCSKKYEMSSAPLSHLFAQGSNALETLLSDDGFRSEVRRVSGLKRHVTQVPPDPGRFVLVYLIFTEGGRKKLTDLPFFAKLSLYRHARLAKQRGVDVRAGTRTMTG